MATKQIKVRVMLERPFAEFYMRKLKPKEIEFASKKVSPQFFKRYQKIRHDYEQMQLKLSNMYGK